MHLYVFKWISLQFMVGWTYIHSHTHIQREKKRGKKNVANIKK